MSVKEQYNKILVAKFMEFVDEAEGGIFTRKTRRRLIGDSGVSGRDRTKKDFWYDQRERVKRALKDLELFIEFAGTEQVNQVITRFSLEPIFNALLKPLISTETDVTHAEIASMLIEVGFTYLALNEKYITRSHLRTVEDAVDLSHFLVETFKPESERSFSGHGWSYYFK